MPCVSGTCRRLFVGPALSSEAASTWSQVEQIRLRSKATLHIRGASIIKIAIIGNDSVNEGRRPPFWCFVVGGDRLGERITLCRADYKSRLLTRELMVMTIE